MIHPKHRSDLLLAPVAVEIDHNLQQVRDKSPADIEADLALELDVDTPVTGSKTEQRAKLILRQAIRNVDMHGWDAVITDDKYRLHLDGGSVSLDLGLSPTIADYIEHGADT